MQNAWKDAVLYILEPLDGCNAGILNSKITELKQSDGEGWAIGEVLDRAVRLLQAAKEITLGASATSEIGMIKKE